MGFNSGFKGLTCDRYGTYSAQRVNISVLAQRAAYWLRSPYKKGLPAFLYSISPSAQTVSLTRRCYFCFTPVPFNPYKPELSSICYLLALLAHHFLHVCRIRVKLLTFRLLMSYIYYISRLRVNNLTLILLTWRKW